MELGRYYAAGEGVKLDAERAFGFFYRAAGKGSVEAMVEVGKSMLVGYGTLQDIPNGVRLARAGPPPPAASAPCTTSSSSTTSTTPTITITTKALHWINDAAAHGSAEAAFRLALLYRDGSWSRRARTEMKAWLAGGQGRPQLLGQAPGQAGQRPSTCRSAATTTSTTTIPARKSTWSSPPTSSSSSSCRCSWRPTTSRRAACARGRSSSVRMSSTAGGGRTSCILYLAVTVWSYYPRPADRERRRRASAPSSSASSGSPAACRCSSISSTSTSSPTACSPAIGSEARSAELFWRVILPIGVSFFVFESISYLVDIYRKDADAGAQLHRLRRLPGALPAPHRRAGDALQGPLGADRRPHAQLRQVLAKAACGSWSASARRC